MCRQKMDPRKDPASKPFTILFLLVVAISVEKVRPEELPFGSRRTSDCNLDNVLQTFLAPEDISSMQMQALRQELWRIMTSPSLNEMPNFDLMADGKLLYDHPMFENKRSSVFERMITSSPYFEKYLATVAKANSMKSRPSMMGKKSIATLAKNGQLPTLQSPEENSETEEEKRNVESLARLGGVHQYMKKSLESLVRNGYLNRPEENTDSYGKRNVGSLARNGELQHKNTADNYVSYYKRNIQNLMRTGGVSGGKRNIASLIRNQNMPIYSEYENQKRNIGTIARDWSLPNHGAGWPRDGEDKRNVAALLRQDSYLHSANRNPAIDAVPTPEAEEVNEAESKRNLPSIKTGPFKYGKTIVKRSAAFNKDSKNTNEPGSKTPARQKRQADEYFSEISNDFPLPDVPKSDGFDYDEFVKALTGDYLSNKKRFLGNIPLSRMTELGKISLLGQQPMSNATPTSPTYRRRQYLLSRTQPDENE